MEPPMDQPTTTDVVLETFPLSMPWPTLDPFLFAVHHHDDYPRARPDLSPDASVAGRSIGNDFSGQDGWSMYHGQRVPGFPQHPHRGFETITYVRSGHVDHSDSLGATARFGQGDTQWMTAGKGVVHSEMFPLLNEVEPNPLEMFQIWLNLPAADKMVDPYFTMLWDSKTPKIASVDDEGRRATITVIAGDLLGHTPASPPPDSWASRTDAAVAVWHISLEPGAQWELPATSSDINRAIYPFEGSSVTIGGHKLDVGVGAKLAAEQATVLVAGAEGVECLVLQGRPIAEPVAQYGPFVMNEPAEIQQAMADYRATGFGGWPWSQDGPTHAADETRFAIHPDGRTERP